MPIRTRDLRTRLLRASPTLLVGNALKDLSAREQPEQWLLIYPNLAGYVVVGLADLAQRAPSDAMLLSRTFDALGLPTSPTADAETELEAAQALLGSSGYVMVLRDDAPWGVLAAPAAGAPAVDALLAQVASWQPPSSRGGILGVEDTIPKTPQETAATTALEAVPTRTDRYVNNDIATEQDPAHALDKKIALRPGEWYYLRVNIGELEASTIDAAPAQLPDVVLKEEVDIRVVVWSERFHVPESENTGVLRVPAVGPATVAVPASIPAGMTADSPLVRQRLLFHIQAPASIGLADLRVSMYCKGVQIQSRLITARVGSGRPLNAAGSQRTAVLDFNLSPTLAPSHLGDVEPHRLSLMVNSDSSGTHAFRVFGQDGNEVFAHSSTLSATELPGLIQSVRNVLQKAAWGYIGDWDTKAPYRYDPLSSAQNNWREDVINLALRGYGIYSNRIRPLAGGNQGVDTLRPLMRTPGMVQLANKVSANDVVPIALFYDYDLDTQTNDTLTICPQFEDSLKSGRDLIDEPCFLGNCPNREGQPTVVCPSGFWGFRHDIGMPWAPPDGPEMATAIAYSDNPLIDIAYFQFDGLGDHLKRLGELDFDTKPQTDRGQTFSMLKDTAPQLVYFYCHGVLLAPTEDTARPALRIGSASTNDFIETDNLDAYRIRWSTPKPRPLVMINGCHTTQLSPDQALSFVSAFVEIAEAAGVIGTEITVFEPLAQAFAEHFLGFFRHGDMLGRAIRRARLQLLGQYNPLGLVYQPFAYAGLKLTQTTG